MKTIFKFKISITALIFIIAVMIQGRMFAQANLSILPVNTNDLNSTILEGGQMMDFTMGLQEFFVQELESIGNSTEMTREHILLLLKGLPALDPENLNTEAYKQICKAEGLDYLVKCSIESIDKVDKNVVAPVWIIVIDGKNGKEFWKKQVIIDKLIPNPKLTEHILLNDVFKPSLKDTIKEMKKLKY